MGLPMRTLILAPLALLTAPAFAQTAAPAQPDIVVTGMGLAAPIGDAAYDVVTIDRTRLTGSASGRLEALPPSPRKVAPWLVGWAERESDRRNC
jgi:hypothetical protein